MMQTNDVVDYFCGNECRLGTLVQTGENRVQLRSAKGETVKIPSRQILCVLPYASIAEAEKEIAAASAEIDSAVLWELYGDRGGEYAFEELSDTCFGDHQPVHLSALARTLPLDVLHFQRAGVRMLVRTPQEVEEMRRLKELRAQRAAKRERTILWLNKALNHPADAEEPFEVPEELEFFVQCTKDYLFLGSNNDAVNFLAVARPKVTAREAGIRLLRATRRMPADADDFLLVNGIHSGFSAEVLAAADAVPVDFERAKRKDCGEECIFSIDDASTREIDDALSFRREGDRLVVNIFIADPAEFVRKGDAIDDAAENRPLSLYLPTTTVMMFPDRISCDLASLNPGVKRPAMAFSCILNDDGELLDWNIAPAVVNVSHHLTYDEADAILAEKRREHPLYTALQELLKLSETLRHYREEDGAVTLNRPELRIHVASDDIRIDVENQDTPAHRLVSECMILCNHVAAKFALRNDIPVIYRVQDPPNDSVRSVYHYDPYVFEQQVRKMKRTRLSTYPDAHFGLGLDLYIQVSSPLRRYADLVLHRQLAAHCKGEPLPYTQEELFVVLDNVERTSQQNRSYERDAKGYWVLEYLRRNCIGQETTATVLRSEGNLILAEIEKYCARGVVMCREKPMPGDRIRVRIQEVLPKSSRMVLAQVEYGMVDR